MGRVISLSASFGEDAQEMTDVMTLLSSSGRHDAQIISFGKPKTGEELARAGMEQAAENADRSWGNWGDMALTAVKEFIRHHSGRFQAEDIRIWARQVPPAPSLRAWGSVFLKASRLGIIKQVGYAQVDNPLAHRANAAVWEVA
jgi:hypothetical protein